jgi:hypothetical protein
LYQCGIDWGEFFEYGASGGGDAEGECDELESWEWRLCEGMMGGYFFSGCELGGWEDGLNWKLGGNFEFVMELMRTIEECQTKVFGSSRFS